MSYLRNVRLTTLAAGAGVALLGIAAATAANAQEAPMWNGAPNAVGPASVRQGPAFVPFFGGPAPYAAASYGPNFGGWAPQYGGNIGGAAAAGVSAPYWLGAPEAVGPG